MKKLIKEIPLANGITVRFFDATRRYFGDYHQVRVTICCELPLGEDLFDSAEAYQAAGRLLGPSVRYLKEIEQQGVAGEETSLAVQRVIRQFVEHSLPYFESEAFPRKLLQSELDKRRNSGPFLKLSTNG